MAKVLIITSSWRKNSNSTCLAGKVAEGARSSGHDVTIADIARLQIGPCRGCNACRKAQTGYCVHKDDMHQFYPMLEAADIIVYASPVYWFNFCGQIKQFIDRCYALGLKVMEDGKSCFSRKKFGVVLAHEGEDAFDSGGVNAIRSIQDMCLYAEAVFAGAFYGHCNEEGEALENAELLERAKNYGILL